MPQEVPKSEHWRSQWHTAKTEKGPDYTQILAEQSQAILPLGKRDVGGPGGSAI
jgi:hypothetical protein